MNTLNVCIGHEPFPESQADWVDLLIAPVLVGGSIKRKILVPDELFGENGHSLSEYAQLIWLYRNLSAVASGYEYINLFQYRRFNASALHLSRKAANAPWVNIVTASELALYASSFDRIQREPRFNAAVTFQGGLLGQFAVDHVLADMLNFARFLVDCCILDPAECAAFLNSPHLIAASSVGVYRTETFRHIFAILERAAGFLHSPNFIQRNGPQRRAMGFLLERLNSYLIHQLEPNSIGTGHYMMISETEAFSPTIGRVN